MQKKLHFFIVDDDPTTVEVYRPLLTKAGYHVDAATKRRDAFEMIAKLQPDCILCDLMMPEKDGFELLKQVRENTHLKQPKFIIISTKSYDFDKRRAFDLGVDGYLRKPINAEKFV